MLCNALVIRERSEGGLNCLHAMDDVNAEFGASVVHFGAMHGLKRRAKSHRVHARSRTSIVVSTKGLSKDSVIVVRLDGAFPSFARDDLVRFHAAPIRPVSQKVPVMTPPWRSWEVPGIGNHVELPPVLLTRHQTNSTP